MKAVITATTISALALLGTGSFEVIPRLIWNASASVPIGFYLVLPLRRPKVGDLVVVDPPAQLAKLLARRGYLPVGTPMLKHVAAVGGQRVCRRGEIILIDGMFRAKARNEDRNGHPLPHWAGCHQLRADELFLLNTPAHSLDGRYFGTMPLKSVRGEAVLVWTFATE